MLRHTPRHTLRTIFPITPKVDRPAPTGVALEATRPRLARMRIVRLKLLFFAFQLSTNAFRVTVNSVEDFCLFAPPEPGPGSAVGNVEVGNH